MRIINKTAKFGNKQDQKFYHERFDNYKEFYDTVMARQPKAYKKLESVLSDGGTSWVGVKSVEQAKKIVSQWLATKC